MVQLPKVKEGSISTLLVTKHSKPQRCKRGELLPKSYYITLLIYM